MEYKLAKENIYNVIKQRNLLSILLGIMLASNVLLSTAVLLKDTKIIIVPANLAKEASISGSKVSSSYIEEMTSFLLSFLLDLTPSNISYKSQVALRYVTPEYYQTIDNQFKEDIKKYNNYNLSTNFTVNELEVNEQDLTVIARGILISNYGKNGASQEPKTYQIKYQYEAGKLLIQNFSVIEQDNREKSDVS